MEYKNEYDDLKLSFENLKQYYFDRKGKRDQVVLQKNELAESIEKTSNNINMLEKVRIILANLSEYAREQARTQIEIIVTSCLQYIFDDEIEFKIEIREVRNKPEAEFYVVSTADGERISTKPYDARGGGIVDIISLAIRVAMLQCSSLKIEGPLILDEPAKHLSDEYIVQAGEFLKRTAKMFDQQVIMVTHNMHLSEIANRCIRVSMDKGTSVAQIDS